MHRIYRPAALQVSAQSTKPAEAFSQAIETLAPKPKAPPKQLRHPRIIKE